MWSKEVERLEAGCLRLHERVHAPAARGREDDLMLTVWVIYYGAKNHPPGKWVVRAQDAGVSEIESADGIRRHQVFFECDSLEEARGKVPEGLYRMDRHPNDDPVIVETWF